MRINWQQTGPDQYIAFVNDCVLCVGKIDAPPDLLEKPWYWEVFYSGGILHYDYSETERGAKIAASKRAAK